MLSFNYRESGDDRPIRTISFENKDCFAIILPEGVTLEGKTYTTHKKAAAASRWATHHKGLGINSVITDIEGNTYTAFRDQTNGKYKLEATGEKLAYYVMVVA